MKTVSIKTRILIALGVFLFSCLFVFWSIDSLCIRGYLPHPKLGPPDYITEVWPLPGSALLAGCYAKSLSGNVFSPNARGIKIGMDIGSIVELLAYDSAHGPFSDRVSLYVDGKEISNSTLDILDLGPEFLLPNGGKTSYSLGAYYAFSWASPLSSGFHTAKLVIVTQSGKLLEYEWYFVIL